MQQPDKCKLLRLHANKYSIVIFFVINSKLHHIYCLINWLFKEDIMDPITLTSTALPALRTIGASADLIVTAATWLYHKITDTQPIEDKTDQPDYQDKTRYDRLCLARKRLTGTDYIPDQWKLDTENKPIKKVLFIENAALLRQSVNDLSECSYNQKLITMGLLTNIESIFNYMRNKKSFGSMVYHYLVYRDDGYEAMFFADLAIWIGITLPRYDVKDPESEKLVLKMIDYCKSVQKEVLVPRNDAANANNPKAKLDIIIKELEQLHKNLCRVNKESSFNDKIQRINAYILEMTKNVFSLFHLMIKDAPHDELQLRELLREVNKDPHLSDPATKKESETLMGRWIVESLKKLGIDSFDYANTIRVDIQSTVFHINYDLSGIRNLNSTGLFPFASQSKEKGLMHLKKIVELHRLLLKLYSVRESVVLTLWPPGPDERVNFQISSPAGIVTDDVTTRSSLTPRV